MAKEGEKKQVLQLVIDDGFVRVPVVNLYGEETGEFYFQPTDIGIVNRFNESMDKFDDVLAPLAKAAEAEDADGEAEATIEALNEARDRLFKLLDYIFNTNTGESLFKNTHPFSPVAGKFYCEEVIEKIGAFIRAQFGEETKKINARMQKYVRQYGRKGGSK